MFFDANFQIFFFQADWNFYTMIFPTIYRSNLILVVMSNSVYGFRVMPFNYTPTHREGGYIAITLSIRSHFRNRYLSFYWKKWLHIYFLFTVRLTNERVGVFLARRSVQHLVNFENVSFCGCHALTLVSLDQLKPIVTLIVMVTLIWISNQSFVNMGKKKIEIKV